MKKAICFLVNFSDEKLLTLKLMTCYINKRHFETYEVRETN